MNEIEKEMSATQESLPPQPQATQPLPLADQVTQSTPNPQSQPGHRPTPETIQFANLPTTIPLTTGQQVKISPLPWSGYKRIRSQILTCLSGEIGDSLRVFAEAFVAAMDKDPGKEAIQQAAAVLVSSGLLRRVPLLLVEIETRFEDLASDLVSACCGGLDLDSLPVFDVLTLRRRVLDSVNLGELLDAEKNLFRGIWSSVMQTIQSQDGSTGTSPAESASEAGGQAGNP